MDSDKTKIIIDEINLWKRSRMLPEEQCNYLLALYTKGGTEGKLQQRRLTILQWFYLFSLIVLVPLSFVLVNLSKTTSQLILALLLFFLCYTFIHMLRNARSQNVLFTVALYVSLVLLLLTTIFFSQTYLMEQLYLLPAFGCIQFASWFFYGYKINKKDLQILSVICFCLSFIYFFI